MIPNIFWSGYCSSNRVVAINEIEKIVNKFGWITDFKQYSDISMMIKIEIEEQKIDDLFSILGEYLILNNFDKLNSSSLIERVIFLNIIFTKGKGDLRVEIPSVPG